VDEVEGKKYSLISAFCFSPDSQRVTYRADQGQKNWVVVDEVEGKGSRFMVEGILTMPFGFSPDSQHVAYSVLREGQDRVVVDGVEGKGFDTCWGYNQQVVFDSPKLLHAVVEREGEFFRMEVEIVEE
jgi:hypothetical protein